MVCLIIKYLFTSAACTPCTSCLFGIYTKRNPVNFTSNFDILCRPLFLITGLWCWWFWGWKCSWRRGWGGGREGRPHGGANGSSRAGSGPGPWHSSLAAPSSSSSSSSGWKMLWRRSSSASWKSWKWTTTVILKILYSVAIAIFFAIYPFFERLSMSIERFKLGMKGVAFFSQAE